MQFSNILRRLSAGASGFPVTSFSDEEVESNPFYKDFLSFLEYIKIHSPKLTATGNLNLKDLAEINECLIRKKVMEEKFGKYIHRVRSEFEMPYIEILDVMVQVMGLCRKFKKRLILIKSAEKKFSPLSHKVKFKLLWDVYIRDLNWAYIQYLENEAEISEVLQDCQNLIWLMLRDYDREADCGWISLEHTLETIRKEFNIGWKTYSGDNIESARWGIKTVIFRKLLEIFDFVEINKNSEEFRLTELGRKVISDQVSFGWGIGLSSG